MRDKIQLVISLLIMGSLGLFARSLSLPTSVVAWARAVIGALSVGLVFLLKGMKLSAETLKKNGIYLLLSGSALGFNWIFLFEAYRCTTVAVATLCYYMAPIFVVILSPLLLKERLTPVKLVCTALAVAGAVLISGGLGKQVQGLRGVGFGLTAAVLYCAIVLLNRRMDGIDGLERTLCQLAVAAVVMTVYVLITEDISVLSFTHKSLLLLATLGVVHTGLAFALYFPAIGKLPAQTSSVLSYIDPVTAIILSALLLDERMTVLQICGMVLILGSTLANELLGGILRQHGMMRQEQMLR